MSIFPAETITVSTAIASTVAASTELPLAKEYAWDFGNNDFLLVDGKFIIVTGKEAIKMWIWKALKTQKNKYRVYTVKYGNELETLVNSGLSTGALRSELERYLKESLLINAYITGIKNIDISIDGGKADVGFIVESFYGEVIINA